MQSTTLAVVMLVATALPRAASPGPGPGAIPAAEAHIVTTVPALPAALHVDHRRRRDGAVAIEIATWAVAGAPAGQAQILLGQLAPDAPVVFTGTGDLDAFVHRAGAQRHAVPEAKAHRLGPAPPGPPGTGCSAGLLSMRVIGASYSRPDPTGRLLGNLRAALGGGGCGLDYDFGGGPDARTFALPEHALWAGSVLHRQPDLGRIVPALRAARLDLGVLVQVEVTGSGATQRNLRTTVYVVDARNGTLGEGVNASPDFDDPIPALEAALATVARRARRAARARGRE